jgi:hypothetical protein
MSRTLAPALPRPADPGARAASLLPLFQRLTALSPSSIAWKNADPALAGVGDVDWVAPSETWEAIVSEVRAWATHVGLGPVVVCRHVPDGMFVVALDAEREFFQLDVRSRATYRGATVFRAHDLVPMAEMDPRGFRTLRPGAEGLLKLVLKGVDRASRPRPQNLRKECVLELMGRDAAGVRQAAALFGPVRGALIAAAESYLAGRWNRPAVVAVELACRLKALRAPSVAVARARFRVLSMRRCPVIRASIAGHRHPPAEYAEWLRRVAASHQTFGLDETTPAAHPDPDHGRE